jgi:hypothetical protein
MKHTTRTHRRLNDTTYELEEVVDAYLIDGVEVTKEEWEQALPGNQPGANDEVGVSMLPAGHCNAWPILSDGFGVHPEQIEQAEAHARSVGAPVEFMRDGSGRAIFTSKQHQRDVLKAHNMHNRDDNAGGQSRTVKRPTIGREEYI